MSFLRLLLLLTILPLAACGTPTTPAPSDGPLDLAALPPIIDVQTANQIREQADVWLLDVREPGEYAESHIPGVTLIPLGEIAQRWQEIPPDKTVIVTCRSGNRSSQAVAFLREQGLTKIHDLQGGLLAWKKAGLPLEP
ncbi:MAG: rhodanese-like domain-containing protein [Caldilineaceae bacterium]|nr:rhodanese-like domain-containing protein [Caldilineaceae bacterium]